MINLYKLNGMLQVVEQILLWHIKTKHQLKYTIADVHIVHDELQSELQNFSAVVSIKLDATELERKENDTALVVEVQSKVEHLHKKFNDEQTPEENAKVS